MEYTFEDAVKDVQTEIDEIGQMLKDGWDKRAVLGELIFLKGCWDQARNLAKTRSDFDKVFSLEAELDALCDRFCESLELVK